MNYAYQLITTMTNHDEYLDEQEPVSAPKMSWTAGLFFSASAAAGIWYFMTSQDFVGAGSILVVLLAAFSGFRLGFSKMGASLAAIAAAIWFAPQLGIQYESQFTEWFSTTGLLNRVIAIGSIGAGIALGGTIVLSFISGRILKNRPRLARTNSWLGFGTGAVQGAVAILLFLGGLLIVEPTELQRANQQVERPATSQKVSDAILTVTEHTHSSKLGPYIEKYNPFTRIPQLNKLEEIQKSVQVLSNPQKVGELLNHPSILQLKQRPEVTEAVNSLMSDPKINAVLNEGGKLDRGTVMSLLNHPALMELIDDEEFMEEASRVIKESQINDRVEI